MKEKNIYYSKTENDNEIVITWRPYATYGNLLYILLIFIFSQLFNATLNRVFGCLLAVSSVALIGNVVMYFLKTRKITKDIREAQKQGICRIEGNRYSLSDPLVVYIKR